MLSAFDHAVIAVNDLGAASDVYARLLGRQAAPRESRDGVDVAAFELANGRVELHAPGGRATALRDHLEQQGQGLYAIAFATTDLKAAAATLTARGLGPFGDQRGGGRPVREPEPGAQPQLELRRAQARGVRVRIVERMDPVRPAQGDRAPGGIERFDHVVVRSTAPEASIRLYRDQLGIRLALDRAFEERGVRLIFFRIAGVTIELAARIGAKDEGERPDSLAGLAFGVGDVRAARERVAASGFDVSEVRTGNKPGTLVCTVREPTCSVPTLLIGADPQAEAAS